MVRFGLAIDPIDRHETLKFSLKAEKLGLSSIWLSDEAPSPPFRDVFVAMTAVALQTKKIMLASGICPVYARHPTQIAATALSLDEYAPGRIAIGVGPGGSLTLIPMGIKLWDRPVTAVRESVEIMKRFLSGETVNYDGKIMKAVEAKAFKKPHSKIPIYVAARGPQMVKLAGELADGTMLTTPVGVIDKVINYIKEGLAKSRRNLKDIDIGNAWPFATSSDGKKARELVKPLCTYFVADYPEEYARMLGVGREVQIELRNAVKTTGIYEASKLVTDEMVENFPVAGTPEECIKKCVAQVKAGVEHIIFGPPFGPKPEEGLETLAKKIIPAIIAETRS